MTIDLATLYPSARPTAPSVTVADPVKNMAAILYPESGKGLTDAEILSGFVRVPAAPPPVDPTPTSSSPRTPPVRHFRSEDMAPATDHAASPVVGR